MRECLGELRTVLSDKTWLDINIIMIVVVIVIIIYLIVDELVGLTG